MIREISTALLWGPFLFVFSIAIYAWKEFSIILVRKIPWFSELHKIYTFSSGVRPMLLSCSKSHHIEYGSHSLHKILTGGNPPHHRLDTGYTVQILAPRTGKSLGEETYIVFKFLACGSLLLRGFGCIGVGRGFFLSFFLGLP